MTAVDTDILVRIVVNDDPAQSARAAAFLRQQERIFLAKTVLLEVEWVLRNGYALGRREVLAILRSILAMGNAEVEDEVEVAQAMRWYESGMDFADSLHVAAAGPECSFVTFDAALRKVGQRLGAGEFIGV
jgi:predicted nucleic-acid-binding protein